MRPCLVMPSHVPWTGRSRSRPPRMWSLGDDHHDAGAVGRLRYSYGRNSAEICMLWVVPAYISVVDDDERVIRMGGGEERDAHRVWLSAGSV